MSILALPVSTIPTLSGVHSTPGVPVKFVDSEETEASKLLHSRLQSPLPWGPQAITTQIFAFLPAYDLARVAGTSISTAVLSRHANLWEALYYV